MNMPATRYSSDLRVCLFMQSPQCDGYIQSSLIRCSWIAVISPLSESFNRTVLVWAQLLYCKVGKEIQREGGEVAGKGKETRRRRRKRKEKKRNPQAPSAWKRFTTSHKVERSSQSDSWIQVIPGTYLFVTLALFLHPWLFFHLRPPQMVAMVLAF